MKKIIALLLVAVMCFSLAACGGDKETNNNSEPQTNNSGSQQEENNNSETATLTKDEMLNSAQALTREEIDKSIENVAFAKSLIGNVYTFGGTIESIEEDHAVTTFYIVDENGNYATSEFVMVANLYLSTDELINLEAEQRLSFVGKLEDVTSREETIPDWGTETIVEMVFKSVAVVSDRFEETGTLHSQNASYGENAWNIKFPNNDYLSVVHFRDDVSSYKGTEITYSYKITGDGCVDAYIVE